LTGVSVQFAALFPLILDLGMGTLPFGCARRISNLLGGGRRSDTDGVNRVRRRNLCDKVGILTGISVEFAALFPLILDLRMGTLPFGCARRISNFLGGGRRLGLGTESVDRVGRRDICDKVGILTGISVQFVALFPLILDLGMGTLPFWCACGISNLLGGGR
jgi:hypothetical protein